MFTICCYGGLMDQDQTLSAHRAATQSASAPQGESQLAQLAAELADLRREVEQLRGENRRLEDELDTMAHAAQHDALTGLFNRRYFMMALHQRIARVSRYGERDAILFVDVDGLKGINDQFGHGAGDEVLCAIANLLRAEIRKTDVVARLGGDEFAILLDHVDTAAARTKMQALRHALSLGSHSIRGTTLRLSASFGMAMIHANDSVESLLGRADSEMYANKRGGDDLRGPPPGA